MIKLTITFSSFFTIISSWTIFGFTTWKLVNVDFNSNFHVDVLANYTYFMNPSSWEASLSFNLEVFKVFNFDSTGKWLIAVVVHHLALGNRTFFAILIDEELSGSDVRVCKLEIFLLSVVELDLLWILNVIKLSFARTCSLF